MKKTILFIILLIAACTLSCYDGLLETRNKTYKLRDIGPAGGLIFYINPNYEKDGWRYLEAAPLPGDGSGLWKIADSFTGGTQTGIGTGVVNTVAMFGATHPVADQVRNYKGGGFSDWFLPSKDELDLMCWNLKGKRFGSPDNPDVPAGGVGSFSSGNYWSSSEENTANAWMLNFITGSPNPWAKSSSGACFIRPVRAF